MHIEVNKDTKALEDLYVGEFLRRESLRGTLSVAKLIEERAPHSFR